MHLLRRSSTSRWKISRKSTQGSFARCLVKTNKTASSLTESGSLALSVSGCPSSWFDSTIELPYLWVKEASSEVYRSCLKNSSWCKPKRIVPLVRPLLTWMSWKKVLYYQSYKFLIHHRERFSLTVDANVSSWEVLYGGTSLPMDARLWNALEDGWIYIASLPKRSKTKRQW